MLVKRLPQRHSRICGVREGDQFRSLGTKVQVSWRDWFTSSSSSRDVHMCKTSIWKLHFGGLALQECEILEATWNIKEKGLLDNSSRRQNCSLQGMFLYKGQLPQLPEEK